MAETTRDRHHITTKADIISLIKTYPKHDTIRGVLEELGWPHHRYQRIIVEIRKIKPELVPKKAYAKERLTSIIEAALKEL